MFGCKLILKHPIDGEDGIQLIDGNGNDVAKTLPIKSIVVMAMHGKAITAKLDIYIDEAEIAPELIALHAETFKLEK